MKHRIHRIVLAGLLLIGFVAMANSLQPAAASALPAQYFAATPGGCLLPDGTPGTVSKDGHTCCPSNAINSDGTADPMRCLYYKYINPTINLLSALVGVIVVIAIVYGAIEYITSAGDPQRIAAGKKRIIEALIGLAAFMLLYSFLQFLVPGGLFSR